MSSEFADPPAERRGTRPSVRLAQGISQVARPALLTVQRRLPIRCRGDCRLFKNSWSRKRPRPRRCCTRRCRSPHPLRCRSLVRSRR